jgi:hypothetical protein
MTCCELVNSIIEVSLVSETTVLLLHCKIAIHSSPGKKIVTLNLDRKWSGNLSRNIFG